MTMRELLDRARAIVSKREEKVTTVFMDFYGGGPKDGDREQVEAGRSEWPCTVARALTLSPWGHDGYNPEANMYGWVVTGRYVRTDRGMEWRAE